MARLARVVIPGVPHHVTQRGNRRQKVFFNSKDYNVYLKIMRQTCETFEVDIWSYCLIPNHIHLLAVPSTLESLTLAMGYLHRQYTSYINSQYSWTGYLWQGRYYSHPLDEEHTINTARYIELNPVEAKIVTDPVKYKWSSARAHVLGENDHNVNVKPILQRVPEWKKFLDKGIEKDEKEKIEKHIRTGRPLGSESFLKKLEEVTGRNLFPRKRGPKSNGIEDLG